MPGQFETYGLLAWFMVPSVNYHNRLQKEYAKEFTKFKPDKKLRWLPHLGTVHLEVQLEDRQVVADVPPLEAAFIELFSEKSMSNLFLLPTQRTYLIRHRCLDGGRSHSSRRFCGQ